jgi:hypothetical protein
MNILVFFPPLAVLCFSISNEDVKFTSDSDFKELFSNKVISNDVVSVNDFSAINVSTNGIEQSDKVNVVLRYKDYFTDDSVTAMNGERDISIEKRRSELRNFYSNKNISILNRLALENASHTYCSVYGPYISYSYETLADFISSDYQTLKSNDSSDLMQVLMIFDNNRALS